MTLKKTGSLIYLIIFFTFFNLNPVRGSASNIHHNLTVDIKPENHFIRAADRITIPNNLCGEHIHFLLHGDLKIVSSAADLNLKREQGQLKAEFFGINAASFEIEKKIPLAHYSLQVPNKPGEDFTFSLIYEGKIHHPIKKMGEEYARGFSETPGIIDEQGVYLSGSTFWVPWFNENVVTFTMDVTLPPGWASVSQGGRTLHQKENGFVRATWDSPQPMDEIYLVCAAFVEYYIRLSRVDVMAFLREEDDSLANKYLETTGQYLEMYEKLIGPYPYSKFALVENFWETGYGMPSFTLLGSKIIRFPFILHSSYPHELLHNWWGNSVFVDYESGNWCEGLTVFLADHLIKEQRNQGTGYRKTTLQGYTDYAAGKQTEFPLSQFKARSDALSSAIGYGKSMMLFNMLRRRVGDRLFMEAIRDFYKNNIYKRASFADLRKSFEKTTGENLKSFFDQWVTRIGVPEIRLSGTNVSEINGKYLLQFTLNQVQNRDAYSLEIPAAVYLEGEKEAVVQTIKMNEKKMDAQLTFASRPIRIDIDPEFDIARKLHQDESAPTLSKIFGAEKILILLPAKAGREFQQGYKELAETWSRDSSGKIEIKPDLDLAKLPADCSIWLFGQENIHKKVVADGIVKYNAGLTPDSFKTAHRAAAFGDSCIVISAKNPANPDQVVVLLSGNRIDALPGLARKLPHYGKYSYLGFSGNEPTNYLKGEWQVKDSPMSAVLTEADVEQALPKRRPLANLAPHFSEVNMMKHLRYLASEELEGRGAGSKGIAKAAAYIANTFKKAGLLPGGDSQSYFQTWYADAGKGNSRAEMRNIIGLIPGSNPNFNNQSVVLCAHYDHLGSGWPVVHKGDEGKIHFGADDNASGVAVLLELAEKLGKNFKPERAIVFIAFTGEESGLLGSKYYLAKLEQNKLKNIIAAVNLDTVGRFNDKINKLMVVGGNSAREWPFIFMGIGYTVGIETELIAQDIATSDQASFIKKGIPGIQIFSGAHADYHRPGDTWDKIIPGGLVKVAAVAREAVVYLSERAEPLTFKGTILNGEKIVPAAGGSSQRRVKTGLMPEFSYRGKGVQIGAVSPASPAQKAGLQKGDIIIKIGDANVADLKQYADALKTFQPGDTTTIIYVRDGSEHTVKITLEER